MNIKHITDNHLCTGCGACIQVCGTNAVCITHSLIGDISAIIDNEKCTQCGLCYTVCPSVDETGLTVLHQQDPFIGFHINTYTGISLNDAVYHNAQSGGLVTQTLFYLFEKNKIGAALVCKTDYGKGHPAVSPVVITNKEDLFQTQGSSYTPLDMLTALHTVSAYESVAIVGLPCHLQGLDSLTTKTKKYGNVKYKLGLFCDRVLSESIVDIFIELGGEREGYNRIAWRQKDKIGYKNAPVVLKNKDGEETIIPGKTRMLLKDTFTAPHCRICFDALNIHADIAFGDPWGMSSIDWERGGSVVVTRTEKGDAVVEDMINEQMVHLSAALFDEVIKGQKIEKRRIRVKTYFQVYKKMGWQVPKYEAKLNLEHIPVIRFGEAKRQVRSYLALNEKPVPKIVKKVVSELKRKRRILAIKNQIRKILYKTNIIYFLKAAKK